MDALYPQEKVIVELDSWTYHQDHPTWISDRERDAHHLSCGYPTVRIAPDGVTDAKAHQLRTILQA